ncbi:MAG: 4Fe-4S binding protein [Candidatus Lokiarchaeota archaeon]
MTEVSEKDLVENYKFHHIDTEKCKSCKTYACEQVCFRGVYKVINKDMEPKCTVVNEREEFCVKCHLCTTACPQDAIFID